MFEAISIERNKQLSARLPTQLKHLKITNGKAIPVTFSRICAIANFLTSDLIKMVRLLNSCLAHFRVMVYVTVQKHH